MTRMLDLIPRTGSLFPRRDMFDRFFEDFNMPALFEGDRGWVPAFDISENEKEYIVTAELPGIDPKDLDVTFSDGIITVKGEKKQEDEDKGKDYHRIERRYGSFHRSFQIPGEIKVDDVNASYKNGILTLTLPKAESSVAKKIEVK